MEAVLLGVHSGALAQPTVALPRTIVRIVHPVTRVTGISLVLLVADLERSVSYFRDRLGFECRVYGDPPNFATADRDAETILLAPAASSEQIRPNWRVVDKMMWDAYIRVDDVDAIYREVQDRGAEIDYTIYDVPSGFREFGVQDPDGHDIAFGQRIHPQPSPL